MIESITRTWGSTAIPLVIAVSGHRDLVQGEIPEIRSRVAEFLRKLQQDYPDRQLQLMSGLAEGADQLAADVALEMGIDLVVTLPMKRRTYRDDSPTDLVRERFDHLCDQATDFYELPLASGNTHVNISSPGPERSRQYAQLGVFLCAHCHILLAIWDGKQSDALGGTAQVVRFHHDNVMPGYTDQSLAQQPMLVDDESDLVYHVVCSRDRPDGEPAEGLSSLATSWLTKDLDKPRSTEMPKQHRLIFQRSSEFSRDAMRHSDTIAAGCYPLYADDQVADLPAGVDDINRLFCVADWLAIRFQKRVLITLRATHARAFLMGLMFILYTDVAGWQSYLVAFLLFFVISAGLNFHANRRGWHRKYLDYRALAEGLRVQFYWAVAGVGHEIDSKFAHDNFLQTQDPELGWIRNIMRVAGTNCDAEKADSKSGLHFALREWVGDVDGGGQLS